jgi:uncharacterized protein YjbI with pentapeptide repeats
MAKPKAKRRSSEPPTTIELPELTPFDGDRLEEGSDLEGVDLSGLDLGASVTLPDVRLVSCRLERCGLDGLVLPRAHIAESLLHEVEAAGLSMRDSTWLDVLVDGARFGALSLTGASLRSVRVRGSRLNFVDLSGATVVDLVFERCAIGELDLSGAEARWVRFDACTIDVLDVAESRLTDVDLTGAQVRAVRGVAGLRGATLGRDQLLDLAPQLADHLGIRVRDEEAGGGGAAG